MPDSNIFAVITAADNLASSRSVINHPRNAQWLRAPDRTARAACPPEGLTYGIKVGKAINSHVVLGDLPNPTYSDTHFNIVVYEDKRIFIVDYSSAQGTAVDYDGVHNSPRYQLRREGKWIVALKPGYSDVLESFTVSVGQAKLRISFPNHATVNNHTYELNLRRLAVAARHARIAYEITPPPANSLNVRISDGVSAEQNIYYMFKMIHRGQHSDIYKAIRACDGEEFAAKVYRCSDNLNRRAWFTIIQGEFDSMRNNAHPNILKVEEIQSTDLPRIIMEYFKERDVAQASLSRAASETVVWQILDALRHLYSRNIIHRRVKPQHILIQTKPTFRAVLTGFELATPMPPSGRIQGGPSDVTYGAPELLPEVARSYGPKIDVWSLGVVATQLLYGLPAPPPEPPMLPVLDTSLTSWQYYMRLWQGFLKARLPNVERAPFAGILAKMIELKCTDR